MAVRFVKSADNGQCGMWHLRLPSYIPQGRGATTPPESGKQDISGTSVVWYRRLP